MKQVSKEIIYDNINETLEGMTIGDLFDPIEIIEYVNNNFEPDEVFDDEKLKEWAHKNIRG